MFKILTTTLLFVLIFQVRANCAPLDSSSLAAQDDYYTVNENLLRQKPAQSATLQPLALLQGLSSANGFAAQLKTQILSLLDFVLHQGSLKTPSVPYNRRLHFGSWIVDGRNETCRNTRAKILLRESLDSVTYAGPLSCTVNTGRWEEPYTGREVTQAMSLQIDHVVPLKNAYVSGASQWNGDRRCLYANYMGNNIHLRAVDSTENMKKSDEGPEDYMPSNAAFHCEYLHDWVTIKLIWGLSLNPREVAAIKKFVQDGQCAARDFVFKESTLKAQRDYIQKNLNLCSFNLPQKY